MTLPDRLYTPKPRPLTELGALGQAARLPLFWRRLKRLPRGNARVFVLPGFMTGDASTVALRRAMARLGHDVSGWGLGRNTGDVPTLLDAVKTRLRGLPATPKLHLIGWSLGGYLAREVARDLPDRIAQVITLASPVIGGPKYTAAAGYYQRQGIDLDAIEREIAERAEVPLKVPVTALFSRTDAIVCPAACIDRVHPGTRHVAMRCSHAGFGFSPAVFEVIAAQLAAPLP